MDFQNIDPHKVFDTVLIPLIQTHPKLTALVMFIGAAKMLVSPLQTLLVAVVKLTPTTKDDEAMQKLIRSRGWKVVAYVFHYITEIKLPGAPGTIVVSVEPKDLKSDGKPTDSGDASGASPSV
jgi:hypothetical protein